MENTYKAIVNRIDTLGVSEPVITVEGENLIRVQFLEYLMKMKQEIELVLLLF